MPGMPQSTFDSLDVHVWDNSANVIHKPDTQYLQLTTFIQIFAAVLMDTWHVLYFYNKIVWAINVYISTNLLTDLLGGITVHSFWLWIFTCIDGFANRRTMLEENSGAPWARTSNLWNPSLTRSPQSYLGRYVKWNLKFYCTHTAIV